MWKSFFLYTRGEQNGIIVLSILIMMVLAVRFSMPYWAYLFSSPQGVDEDFVKQVHELNAQLTRQSESEKADSFFYFNPNTVTEDELLALGFSAYQRKSFMGYRSKVTNFTTDADLLQVYGIDSAFFAKLRSYIVLDKSIESQPSANQPVSKDSRGELQWVNFNEQEPDFWDENIVSDSTRLKITRLIAQNHVTKSLPLYKVRDYSDTELYHWLSVNSKPRNKDATEDARIAFAPVELNTADTAQLCLLKGIGSKLSLRIVNFRNSLGGFYHVSQLADVYGISDELFNSLKIQVRVDKGLVQKINPQNLTIQEISKHPYIDYNQAKELKNMYRKNKILKATDDAHPKSFTKEEWQRIKHYLVLSE